MADGRQVARTTRRPPIWLVWIAYLALAVLVVARATGPGRRR